MISFQISPESSSIQRVTINNVIFYIQLDWSVRESSWYFTLMDVQRKHLVSGRKLQLGTSPTERYTLPSLGGNIYVYQSKDTDLPLGRRNFGQDLDYQLVWIATAEEIELGLA